MENSFDIVWNVLHNNITHRWEECNEGFQDDCQLCQAIVALETMKSSEKTAKPKKKDLFLQRQEAIETAFLSWYKGSTYHKLAFTYTVPKEFIREYSDGEPHDNGYLFWDTDVVTDEAGGDEDNPMPHIGRVRSELSNSEKSDLFEWAMDNGFDTEPDLYLGKQFRAEFAENSAEIISCGAWNSVGNFYSDMV